MTTLSFKFVILFVVLATALSARAQTCRQTEVYPASISSTTAPLRILALGTSLMWGNGLRPAETFRHQVTDSLTQQTGRPFQLITYAHSGALLTTASQAGSIPENPALDQGSINESLPTVDDQVACAVADHLTDATLILVEGCINDVGAETIVYPWTERETIRRRADEWCGHMSETLTRIDQSFPSAFVIVVGYYPIVSHDTPFLGWFIIPHFIKHAQKVYESKHPQMRSLSKPKRSRRDREGIAAANSEIFYQHSKRALQRAVKERNADGTNRFAFAGLPEITEPDGTVTVDPSFAFGASHRRLWLIPIRILPFWVIFSDHTYWSRQKLCRDYAAPDVDQIVCQSNAAAHPNVPGADLFAKSIQRALPPAVIAEWRGTTAPLQTIPPAP